MDRNAGQTIIRKQDLARLAPQFLLSRQQRQDTFDTGCRTAAASEPTLGLHLNQSWYLAKQPMPQRSRQAR
jgi:hypothetical protein